MNRTMLLSVALLLALLGTWIPLRGTASSAQSVLTVSQTSGTADFTSIQAALDAANPGDIVQINDSTAYAEHLKITKNNLTLRAAEGQLPLITGRPDAPDNLDLIDVSGTDGVTIQGLKLLGGTDDGITASPGPGATNLMIEGCQFESLNDTGIIVNMNSTATIRNNVFTGLGTGAMKLGNGINVIASTATVTGNTFMELGRGPDATGTGMSISSGSQVTCTRNTFDNLRGPGLLVFNSSISVTDNIFKGGILNGEFSDGIELVRSSADIIGNRFLETGRLPIGTFIPQPDSSPRVISTVNIINNLIAGSGFVNAQAGIGMQLLATNNTRNTFNVINNTLSDNTVTAILYAVEGVGSSVNLVNNILTFSGGAGDILTTQAASQRLSALTARNNLFGRDVLMLVGNNGNIMGDPLFVNPGDSNYRLQMNSPAINQGDSAVANLPSTDLDGNPRIVGPAVDMGAYEFQP